MTSAPRVGLASSAPVTPPRPNLGPEPWSEAGRPVSWMALAGAGLAIVVAFVFWAAWRRRRRAKLRPPPAPHPDAIADSPAERLIAQARSVRSAIEARLGPEWAARTTEEVAGSAAVRDWLGAARAEELRQFLSAADRAKFASFEAAFDGALAELQSWDAWADAFLSTAAGATVKING